MDFSSIPTCVQGYIVSFVDSNQDLLSIRGTNKKLKELADKRIIQLGKVCFLVLKEKFLILKFQNLAKADPRKVFARSEKWRLTLKRSLIYKEKNIFQQIYYDTQLKGFNKNEQALFVECFCAEPDDQCSKMLFQKNVYRNFPVMEMTEEESFSDIKAKALYPIMRGRLDETYCLILRIENAVMGKIYARYTRATRESGVKWKLSLEEGLKYDIKKNARSLLHYLHHQIEITELGENRAFVLFKTLVQTGDNGFDRLW